MTNLECMAQGYVGTALWASIDDFGCPLDAEYIKDDIAVGTLLSMHRDCERFLNDHTALIAQVISDDYGYDDIGHDFWLTRNRHGAGFWDRDLGEAGEQLTQAAHEYGEISLYVVDGMIYS